MNNRKLFFIAPIFVAFLTSQLSGQSPSDIKPPEVRLAIAPIFPPLAFQSRTEGVVKVDISIGVDGSVKSAKVCEGHELLNQTSIESTKQWRFAPRQAGGSEQLTFTFKIMPKGSLEKDLGSRFILPFEVEIRREEPQYMINTRPIASKQKPNFKRNLTPSF